MRSRIFSLSFIALLFIGVWASGCSDTFPPSVHLIDTVRDSVFVTGPTWRFQNSGSFTGLMAIDLSVPLSGLAGGLNGYLIQTQDSGTHWSRLNVPTSATITALKSLSSSNICLGTSDGRIYRSTDGGVNWSNSTLDAPVTSMSFPTASIGFALTSNIGSGSIYTSNDGGTTWLRKRTVSSGCRCIRFVDEMRGVILLDGGAMLRTIDGGVNWTPVSSPVPSGRLDDLAFLSASVLYACGTPSDSNSGVILRSADGAATWTSLGAWPHELATISCGPTGWLAAAGYGGLALFSRDDGSNWSDVSVGNGKWTASSWTEPTAFVLTGADGRIAERK